MKLVVMLMALALSGVVFANETQQTQPPAAPKVEQPKPDPHDAMRLHFLSKRPYVAPKK
jgi:hypothetical protein